MHKHTQQSKEIIASISFLPFSMSIKKKTLLYKSVRHRQLSKCGINFMTEVAVKDPFHQQVFKMHLFGQRNEQMVS